MGATPHTVRRMSLTNTDEAMTMLRQAAGTGRTLRVSLAQVTIVISHMGHSEGRGIAAKLTESSHGHARTPALPKTNIPIINYRGQSQPKESPVSIMQAPSRRVRKSGRHVTHHSARHPSSNGPGLARLGAAAGSEAGPWSCMVENADKSLAPHLTSGCRSCHQMATTIENRKGRNDVDPGG